MPKSIVSQPYLDNYIEPMWEVERSTTSKGATLRLGHERIQLGDIASYTAVARETRHRQGRVLAMTIFGSLGMALLIGVMGFEMRTRMLLAAFILFSLTLMALQDTFLQSRQRITHFNIRLKDGSRVAFATHDASNAAALDALLAQHGATKTA